LSPAAQILVAPPRKKEPAADDTREASGGTGLEIIAKLATVLEVEPAELLRVPPGMPERPRPVPVGVTQQQNQQEARP